MALASPGMLGRLRRAPAPLLPAIGGRWLLLAAGTGWLSTVWFGRNHFRSLMGDDIYLLWDSRRPGGFASSFWHGFAQTGGEKWRPLVTSTQALLTDVLGDNYQAWLRVLTMLEWANAVAVAYFAWVLSGRRWSVAILTAVAMITSRFNTYFVWQTYGWMEGLALSSMLVTLACARRAWQSGSGRWTAGMVLGAAAASLCHERYLCLLSLTFLVPLLGPHYASTKARFAWMVAAVLVPVSNYVVKVYLFHVHFLTGNGGEMVHPDVRLVLTHAIRGMFSLSGYLLGPPFLTGADARALGLLPVLMTLIFVLASCLLIVVALVSDVRQKRGLRVWLLGPALFGGVLLMASISSRQEMRWLYSPQVVMLLSLAWASQRARSVSLLSRHAVAVWLVAVALVASVTVDLQESRHVDSIYFMVGQRMADSVLDRALRQHADELSTTTIFLLSDKEAFRGFYFAKGRFFDIYAPGADVRFVHDRSQISAATHLRRNRLVYEVRLDQVIQVPE